MRMLQNFRQHFFHHVVCGFAWCVLGLPLLAMLADSRIYTQASGVASARLFALLGTTLTLTAAALVLAVPSGTLLALVLTRTDMPLRRLGWWTCVVGVAVPLPVWATAWQTTWVSAVGWQPWALGWPAAAWVHGLAGVPWVVVLVSVALARVEPELEEVALTQMGPARTALRVTLPRIRSAVQLAAIFVAVQTAGEIVITDMMQVRTAAEEVYTQLVAPLPGDPDGLPRAVAVALVSAVPLALILAWVVQCWLRDLPAGESAAVARPVWRLGRWRGLVAGLTLLSVAGVTLVPVALLLWQAGVRGVAPWSIAVVSAGLWRTGQVQAGVLANSLLTAVLTGLLASSLAWSAAWALRERGRAVLIGLAAGLWGLPGPIIGLGIKEAIQWLMEIEATVGLRFVQEWLYAGPSPLPVVWATTVRFWPGAVAVLAPAIWAIPREVWELAQVEGVDARRIVARWSRPAWWASVAIVAVLTLGELSASKLVETPNGQTLIHEIFNQMHYGTSADLAALCLWQVGLVASVGGVALVLCARK